MRYYELPRTQNVFSFNHGSIQSIGISKRRLKGGGIANSKLIWDSYGDRFEAVCFLFSAFKDPENGMVLFCH